MPPSRRACGSSRAGSRKRGRNKWWLFEGFARVDACFVTEHLVMIMERWHDELTSSSSRRYPERLRLWRDLEATREFAAGRMFITGIMRQTVARRGLQLAIASGCRPRFDGDHEWKLGR